MPEAQPKTARLEARLPAPVYELLRSAADLQGRSLSDFVVASAREAAEEAIARHELLRLTQEEQERFAAQLLRPSKPNAALRRAMKLHDELVEPS